MWILNVLTTTTSCRWRNRNGGVKTAGWWTLRRRSTLHHAVKDERVTVQGPVKKPQMDCMSNRGEEGEGGGGPFAIQPPTLRSLHVWSTTRTALGSFPIINRSSSLCMTTGRWSWRTLMGYAFIHQVDLPSQLTVLRANGCKCAWRFGSLRDSYFAGAAMSTRQRTTISHTLQWHLIKC